MESRGHTVCQVRKRILLGRAFTEVQLESTLLVLEQGRAEAQPLVVWESCTRKKKERTQAEVLSQASSRNK